MNFTEDKLKEILAKEEESCSGHNGTYYKPCSVCDADLAREIPALVKDLREMEARYEALLEMFNIETGGSAWLGIKFK